MGFVQGIGDSMTRQELRDQIRMTTLLESNNVSDTELNNLIDAGLHWVDLWYPWPVSIVELSTDGSSPAFAEPFHWILVHWAAAKLYEREEYFDVAQHQMNEAINLVRHMAEYYTKGRAQ